MHMVLASVVEPVYDAGKLVSRTLFLASLHPVQVTVPRLLSRQRPWAPALGRHLAQGVVEPLSWLTEVAALLCTSLWLSIGLPLPRRGSLWEVKAIMERSTRPSGYLGREQSPLGLGEQPSNVKCGNYPDIWFPTASQQGQRAQVFYWLTLPVPLGLPPLKGKAAVLWALSGFS